jgi:hypothetical protein
VDQKDRFSFALPVRGDRLRTALTWAAAVVAASTIVIAAMGVGAAPSPPQRPAAAAGLTIGSTPGDSAAGGGGTVRIGIFPSEEGADVGSPSPPTTSPRPRPSGISGVAAPGGRSEPASEPGSGGGVVPSPRPPPPSRPSGHGSKTPLPASPPTRIWIPSIGVTSNLIRLGLNPDGSLEVPSNFAIAGWWAGGRSPGELGAAVIVGHVDSKSGPAVFYRLRTLRHGDPIWVQRQDGRKVRFVVQRLQQVPKTNFPTQSVYGYQPHVMLRLITCGGAFNHDTGHYVDNVIVFATASA